MSCHPPLQIGPGGDDGREVGRLRGSPGGVRQDEVGLFADRGQWEDSSVTAVSVKPASNRASRRL